MLVVLAIIPLVISFCSFVVALFAWRVGAERFRLDLYNKRFDIYQRTVKFYQALMRSSDYADDGNFLSLRADFIIASRESQFLFGRKSGVYNLLHRLNNASFKITGYHDIGNKGLPPETLIGLQKEFSDALRLWNESMEPLELAMAPYLNFHYVSMPSLMDLTLWRRLTK